jgi:hypothetical protein
MLIPERKAEVPQGRFSIFRMQPAWRGVSVSKGSPEQAGAGRRVIVTAGGAKQKPGEPRSEAHRTECQVRWRG